MQHYRVESANKLVVEARLKGAGMRWGRQNVNSMLVLRNAVCNREWKHTYETALWLIGKSCARNVGTHRANSSWKVP